MGAENGAGLLIWLSNHVKNLTGFSQAKFDSNRTTNVRFYLSVVILRMSKCKIRITGLQGGATECLFLDTADIQSLGQWIEEKKRHSTCWLKDLAADLIVYILTFMGVRGRAMLGATCTEYNAICKAPISKRLSMSTKHILPPARGDKTCDRYYYRTHWADDLPRLLSVFRDTRLSKLQYLTVYINSPALATEGVGQPCGYTVATQREAFLPALLYVKIECDPRVCAAPGAPLMRRLLPVFRNATTIVIKHMENVGVSHFMGLSYCRQLTGLHFMNCRMSAPLSHQRRSVDGSLLQSLAGTLKKLTLDFWNLRHALSVLNHYPGPGLMQSLQNLRELGLPCYTSYSEKVIYDLLTQHEKLRILRTHGGDTESLESLVLRSGFVKHSVQVLNYAPF